MAGSERDWTKPAAIALSKEDCFEMERGRWPGVSEDARVPVRLFSETGITTVFTQSRRLPGGLEGEPEGVCEVRPGVPVPQLPGVRRVPVRDRR